MCYRDFQQILSSVWAVITAIRNTAHRRMCFCAGQPAKWLNRAFRSGVEIRHNEQLRPRLRDSEQLWHELPNRRKWDARKRKRCVRTDNLFGEPLFDQSGWNSASERDR